MKLYTKGGDKGKTSLIGGRRVGKHDLRVDAYGTVDEVNSFVGLSIVLAKKTKNDQFKSIIEELTEIQNFLFDCGTDLANISDEMPFIITEEHINWLEEKVDAHEATTPTIEKFILPGGSEVSAQLHICRTVTRRAERVVSELLTTDEEINEMTFKFLNRLSDYFFIVARKANHLENIEDIYYDRSKIVFH